MKIKDLLKDYICKNNDVFVKFEYYQFNDVFGSWELGFLETYKLSELLDESSQNDSVYSEIKNILDSNVIDYFSKDNSNNLTICINENFEYFGEEVQGIKITKYDN